MNEILFVCFCIPQVASIAFLIYQNRKENERVNQLKEKEK